MCKEDENGNDNTHIWLPLDNKENKNKKFKVKVRENRYNKVHAHGKSLKVAFLISLCIKKENFLLHQPSKSKPERIKKIISNPLCVFNSKRKVKISLFVLIFT